MTNVLLTLKNYIRPLYWNVRFPLLNSQWMRRNAVSRKLKNRLDAAECSICRSAEIFRMSFFIEHQIDKCYCKQCQHIFSHKLNHNLDQASQQFAYHRPNDQYQGQKQLQVELINKSSLARGRYLDFGVGGNIGIANELRQVYPQHEFFACDLYPSTTPGYFQLYSSVSSIHMFDGISSNAVVEHLDNTLEAWRYFNRLLKPLSEGGGIMIHAFPSQIVEDLDHWAIKIESHECLFSEQSLELICRQSGFALMRVKYFASVQHPVYYFRKTFDYK